MGVGIALGGAAAPGCFGRSHFDAGDAAAGAAGDSNHEPDTSDALTDGTSDASTDSASDASSDGALDASADGPIDPYCDVSWPPTKANPTPGTVPCVDPLHECADASPPWRCYRMIEPGTCLRETDYDGPLYCVDGDWRCPPNSDEGERCTCWSADGGGCPDASAGDMPGADGGDAAN